MSRYIKLDGIDNIKKEIFMPDDYAIGWNEAIDHIKEIPTADVVEMPVRCKDCIYCEQVTIPTSITGMLFICRRILMNVGEYGDGFCSWGVKYSQAKGKEVRNDVQIR